MAVPILPTARERVLTSRSRTDEYRGWTTEPGASDKIALENIINGERSHRPPTAPPWTSSTRVPVRCMPPRRCPVPPDVDRAYAAATEAFKTWRWSTPGERQLALLKFADHLEANADELVAVEVTGHRQACR